MEETVFYRYALELKDVNDMYDLATNYEFTECSKALLPYVGQTVMISGHEELSDGNYIVRRRLIDPENTMLAPLMLTLTVLPVD